MQYVIFFEQGYEEIETITAFDIMKRAGMNVILASTDDRVVYGAHGLPLLVDIPLQKIKNNHYDGIIIPGGLDNVESLLKSEEFNAFLLKNWENGVHISAICAAPLILEKHGLLASHHYTCHPGVADRIKTLGRSPEAVVSHDRIVTGRSPGVALEWALKTVEHFLGKIPDGLLEGLAQD